MILVRHGCTRTEGTYNTIENNIIPSFCTYKIKTNCITVNCKLLLYLQYFMKFFIFKSLSSSDLVKIYQSIFSHNTL